MTDLEIMENQSKLIDLQKRLFINTVEQFKRDLSFLQGSVMNLKTVNQDDKLNLGLVQIFNHIYDMHSMLNDFEARLDKYERD